MHESEAVLKFIKEWATARLLDKILGRPTEVSDLRGLGYHAEAIEAVITLERYLNDKPDREFPNETRAVHIWG